MHNDPLIKLEDTEIPVVNEYKLLGVIFDRKLSFISHIKYLKTKTTRAQQLRSVAHTKWGADCQSLLKLYRALVRSQFDYGIFIYRSARKSYLKKLDPIHHEGLRLVLGAFRTSPVASLSVYTPKPMKHPHNSDVKNWRCSITQNWNPASPTQLTTASSTANTNNSMNKKKKPSNHLASWWILFSKNPQFLLQMYIKVSYHKYHVGSLKTTSNSPIKRTPQDKNTSQHLPGKI